MGDVCDGCLGSTRCWVCLGRGVLDDRSKLIVTCHRCYGSGKCSYCQVIRVVDMTGPALLDDDPDGLGWSSE